MDDGDTTGDPKAAPGMEIEKRLANENENEESEEAALAAAEADEAESIRKRGGMDNVGGSERLFAFIKDRFYDDRLNALNTELAILEDSSAIHPEFQAMLQCLDARRDEKIDHEHISLRFNVDALERTSIAERAQIHSEYFQTLRETREQHLDRVGKQFHEIQADRRRSESGISDYILPFPVDRAEQISQQVVYNKEVSVLSGFAKYVGFPAAPEIEAIPPSAIDDDLRKMGIKSQAGSTAAPQSTPIRNSIVSNAIHRKPAAEEQFIEQTPWANPQHPIHQKMLHQVQHVNDDSTPSSAPVVSKSKRKSPNDDNPKSVERPISKVPRHSAGPVKGGFSPEALTDRDVTVMNLTETLAQQLKESNYGRRSPPSASKKQGQETKGVKPPHRQPSSTSMGRAAINNTPADSAKNTEGSELLRSQGPQSVVAGAGSGNFG